MSTFTKDPNAVLDYSVDWSGWLADGETISTSTWVVPDGLTAGASSHDATTTTLWLSGGTARKGYSVTNRITTSAGRTDDRSMWINCLDR